MIPSHARICTSERVSVGLAVPHSPAMAVAPSDGRQHDDVTLAGRHARGPEDQHGAADHAPSHTCDHPFLARAKRSNLARGGARAEVA